MSVKDPKPGNLLAQLPRELPEEFFETIAERGEVCIERIVSSGHATPEGYWYDQAWDEWVLVLTGSAGLLLEGETSPRALVPGDYLMIPAGRRHRVEWTDADLHTVWLAVHFGKHHYGQVPDS